MPHHSDPSRTRTRSTDCLDKWGQLDRSQRICSRKVVVVLCYGQVIIAFLAIVSQFIGLAYPYEGYGYANAGISCGIVFGISGLFGIWAGSHPSKCTIITHMVFAIISACFSILLIIYAVIFSVVIADTSYNELESDLNLGIFITLAVIGLVQSIISITTSALSCSVICCNDQSMNSDNHVPDTNTTKKLIMSKNNAFKNKLLILVQRYNTN